MATCALTHRFRIDRIIVAFSCITHSALRVIHRTCHHTCKWNRSIKLYHIIIHGLPFQLFHAGNTFVIDDIGISTLQTCGFMNTMEVEHDLVFCTRSGSSVKELRDLLIVTIHKVHLETFDAHICIVLNHILHIAVEGFITGPEHQTHIFRFRIRGKLFQIDFRNYLHQVSLLVYSPTFVKDDIFDAMFGGKIDVILIGIVVDAGMEIHAVDIPIVPPIPSHLARFDP